MMNNKMKNAWEFVKENKKKIIFGAAAVVGGFILFKTGAKYVKIAKAITPLPNPEGFTPEIGVGEVVDFARYDSGSVDLWMDKIPLADMGKLGEEIVEKVPDLPENPIVWSVMNIRPDEVVET